MCRYVSTSILERIKFQTIDLDPFVPPEVMEIAKADPQKSIPVIAKDPRLSQLIEDAVYQVPSSHCLYLGDSRSLSVIPDESVHLVVTSPPY